MLNVFYMVTNILNIYILIFKGEWDYMWKNNRPLISVFMPLNDTLHLDDRDKILMAINSVLNQSYRNIEVIMLNNQVNDDALINQCQKIVQTDGRVVLIEDMEKRCLEENINRIETYITGDYCVINTGRVLWDCNYLLKILDAMENNPDVDFAYCNGIYGNDLKKVFFSSQDVICSKSISAFSNFYKIHQFANAHLLLNGLFRTSVWKRLLPLINLTQVKDKTAKFILSNFFLRGHGCLFIDEKLLTYYETNEITNIDSVTTVLISINNEIDYFQQQVMIVVSQIKIYDLKKSYIYCLLVDILLKNCEKLFLNSNLIIKDETKNSSFMLQDFNKLQQLIHVPEYEIGNFINDAYNMPRFDTSSIVRFIHISIARVVALRDLLHNNKITTSTSDINKNLLNIDEKLVIMCDFLNKQGKIAIEKTSLIPEFVLKPIHQNLQDKSNEPKLSVIATSLNLGRFLEETINSIQNQTCKEYELIVIDGASTDNTLDILKAHPEIRWISEKDSCYTEAFWKGLNMARGKYVMQCCVSDGYLDNQWFERCVKILDSDLETSVVWGFPQYLTEDSHLGPVSYPQFFYHMAPQKHSFFLHWLNTAFWLPENNFCARKIVWEQCYPVLSERKPELNEYLEFNYRFHLNGFLTYHIPVIASFGRTHKNQKGAIVENVGLEKIRLDSYFHKVNKFREQLVSRSVIHHFRNGNGDLLCDLNVQ